MKRFLLFTSLVALMCLQIGRAYGLSRVDLTGRVVAENGAPLEKASVFIYTAGPRTGLTAVCPSCYPDCRKKAITDAKGQFQIDALDPKLLFKILVVAGDHEAQFVSKVDPVASPLQITMKRFDRSALKSKLYTSGVVLSPDGEPIIGAVIDVQGVERKDSTQWGGNEKAADPVAVSDDKGRFFLRCNEGITGLHGVVAAPGVAKRWVRLVPGRDHIVAMQEGVVVSGRVAKEGKPLPDVIVAMATMDRACGQFLNGIETMTDAQGRFVLYNVPPNNHFHFFAKMDSLRDHGMVPIKSVKVGATGTSVQLENVEVKPAYRVTGRIVLEDGSSIPPETRMILSREHAWDYTDVLLDPEGRFEFRGVPNESVTLGVRVKEYRFSTKNRSLDWLNGTIVGTVEKDTELILLMEKGDWQFSRQDEAPPGIEKQPLSKPLRSAPIAQSGTGY